MRKTRLLFILLLPMQFALASIQGWAFGQDAQKDSATAQSDTGKKWSIHFQATAVGDWHGSFASAYEGQNSLPPHPETRMSFTTTAFLDLRLTPTLDLVVNPEVSAGRGFGQVTGLAGFPNGEITRVTSVAPRIYPARAYLRQVWALGKETEAVDESANQIGGRQPRRRLTWIVGKFAVIDFFDVNRYANDPRTQFLNWALMYNGAWDYPADVRGYTIGTVLDLTVNAWSLRAAVALEPTAPNGPALDSRVTKNRGTVAEWEWRHRIAGRAGALRLLGYLNRGKAGTFREAFLSDGTTDIEATRRNGARKYGFGLNFDQEITDTIGVFGRYGWNDGKTESFAFTQIDRTLTGGFDIRGNLWKRPSDHAGIAAVTNYLSGDQRRFLAAGGLGFIIGDDRLNCGPESAVEAFYAWEAIKGWTVTADYQHFRNPAYNRDRGPVTVLSLRLHWEK